MKRIISFLLALVIMLSLGISNAYAAKMTAEEKLQSIQKMEGFIPGKNSNPTNNCFKFVSNVCEKLYGETYYYERLHDNYLADHDSGKFYTVGTLVITNSTINDTDAKKIKDFFVNKAKAGDVVHYGGYKQGSTHTFMIQHIDSKKMQIYHSNYGFGNYSSTQCHIDTILWSNFLKNPMKSEYDSNNDCVSANSIFYNKMKSQGLGVSINRFTNYDKLFSSTSDSVAAPSAPAKIVPDKVTGLATTKVNTESISIKWDSAKDAEKYYVSVKNNTQKTEFGKSVTTTSTTLNGLTEKNEYVITVKAISTTGHSGADSDSITVVAKNSVPKVKNVEFTSRSTTSFAVKWDEVKGAESYYVLIKNLTKNSEFSKEVDTNSTTLNNFTPGNIYSVRVKACVKGSYGSYSKTVRNGTKPNAPKLKSVSSPSKKTVAASWKRVSGSASGYRVYISTDKKFKKNVQKLDVAGHKTTSAELNGLKKGKTYYVKVRSYKSFGSQKIYSSYSAVQSIKCR